MRPNASPVLVNDALDRCETDSRSFKLFGAVEALEWAEEFFGTRQIETDAVVPHENGRLALDKNSADFNNRRIACPRVLNRIGD